MFETVLLKITTIMLEQRQNEMSIQATLDEANLIEAMLAEQDELTAAKSLDSFDKADPQTHGSALRIQIQGESHFPWSRHRGDSILMSLLFLGFGYGHF